MAQLPLPALIDFSRALRHYLKAGLSLTEVVRQQATKGPAAIRPVARAMADDLRQGHDLAHALTPHRDRFPPLFIALAAVGEETGNLPEVFHELERYFTFQRSVRRQFWRMISWPIIQFVLATLIIAAVIFVLGMFQSPFDPLGLGLTGAGGALVFLGIIWGGIGATYGVYLLLTRVFRRGPQVHRFLLRIPALGPCLQSLALQRLCLALRLTTDSGLSTQQAARLSLRATDNEAFADRTDDVIKAIDNGQELAVALAKTRMLPEDLLNVLATAEDTGQIPEMMQHQAEYYEEESQRRMKRLAAVAGTAVIVVVGGFIILAIFRMALTYFNMIGQAAR